MALWINPGYDRRQVKLLHTCFRSARQMSRFAEVTSDVNPVHLDPAYAAITPFRKQILDRFLSASVASKVFGTRLPGHGTIYVLQDMTFNRPMYPGGSYMATYTIGKKTRREVRSLLE